MKTYGIKLVRVSDSLTIQGTVAEGPNGPMLALGSEPHSAAVAGRRGRIIVPSFHKGSGQVVEQEAGRYNTATGWDATRPGHLRTVPAMTRTLLDAAYPTNNEAARGAIFSHQDAGEIIIAPQAIYEEEAVVDTAPVNTRFTGSYAVYGDRTFFGLESTVGAARTSTTCRVRTGTAVGTYANAGFAASYFCQIGNKLFRCVQNATAPKVTVSWTDETGSSSPTFSTGYTYPTQKWAMDMAQLGPHAVVALGGGSGSFAVTPDGEVIIVDVSGNFSNIIPPGSGLPNPIKFIPFRGGQVLAVTGAVGRSIFLADAQSISDLPFTDSTFKLPGIAASAGAAGIMDASEFGGLLLGAAAGGVLPIYGAIIGEDGRLYPHEMKSYGIAIGATGNILAARLVNDAIGDRYVRFIRVENTNDLYVYTQPLWTGATIVNAVGGGSLVTTGNQFVTPYFHGGSWGLKQFLSVSGYGAWYPGAAQLNETITIQPLTDDAIAPTGKALTAAEAQGAWELLLDETAIGRSMSLTISMQNPSAGAENYDLHCPLMIDYVEIPNQQDLINVTLLAGSIQMTRGGTLSKQARKEILDNISSALQNPSRWTLTWWDGRADWTVVPIKYTSQEVEDAARPGEGAALVTIVLQRLFTDPTVAGG